MKKTDKKLKNKKCSVCGTTIRGDWTVCGTCSSALGRLTDSLAQRGVTLVPASLEIAAWAAYRAAVAERRRFNEVLASRVADAKEVLELWHCFVHVSTYHAEPEDGETPELRKAFQDTISALYLAIEPFLTRATHTEVPAALVRQCRYWKLRIANMNDVLQEKLCAEGTPKEPTTIAITWCVE